jgi:hypothetical protein
MSKYLDNRPDVRLRMPTRDHGIVLPYGTQPERLDCFGARDMWVFEADGEFHLFYDGNGP